jgi:hypothetical protein
MPYIKRSERPGIDHGIEQALEHITTPGQLNYAITAMCLGYLPAEASYGAYNAVMGVLSCASAELYRRHVAPYEDWALVRNGPV